MPDRETPIRLSTFTSASTRPLEVTDLNRYTHPGCRSVPDSITGLLKFSVCELATTLYVIKAISKAILVIAGYKCFILWFVRVKQKLTTTTGFGSILIFSAEIGDMYRKCQAVNMYLRLI